MVVVRHAVFFIVRYSSISFKLFISSGRDIEKATIKNMTFREGLMKQELTL